MTDEEIGEFWIESLMKLDGISSRKEAIEAWEKSREVTTGPFDFLRWQPIETAPKDGTVILVWLRFGGWDICAWDKWTNSWSDGETSDNLDPTHWMMPPEPPTGLTCRTK